MSLSGGFGGPRYGGGGGGGGGGYGNDRFRRDDRRSDQFRVSPPSTEVTTWQNSTLPSSSALNKILQSSPHHTALNGVYLTLQTLERQNYFSGSPRQIFSPPTLTRPSKTPWLHTVFSVFVDIFYRTVGHLMIGTGMTVRVVTAADSKSPRNPRRSPCLQRRRRGKRGDSLLLL